MDHYFSREEGVGNFETNMHNLSIRKKKRKLPSPPPPWGNWWSLPNIRFCQSGMCSSHLRKISTVCTKHTFKVILSLIHTFSIGCTGHNFQQLLSQTAKFHRARSWPPLVLPSPQRYYTLKRLIRPQEPGLVNSYSTGVICKKATILLRTEHSEWGEGWVARINWEVQR